MKKVYIVEDRAITRATLEAILTYNNFEVVGSSASATSAWADIKKQYPDLVLIDVNLIGEHDGIWLAQKIKDKLNIPFFYLTAYGDNITLEKIVATEPFGYIKKPFNKETLVTNLNLAIKKHEKDIAASTNYHRYIYIKENLNKIKLYTKDILFVQSDSNYLHVHTINNGRFFIRQKLGDFLQKLPKQHFKQTHLRYLVNLDRVEAVQKTYVLINQTKIPISNTHKDFWSTVHMH